MSDQKNISAFSHKTSAEAFLSTDFYYKKIDYDYMMRKLCTKEIIILYDLKHHGKVLSQTSSLTHRPSKVRMCGSFTEPQ